MSKNKLTQRKQSEESITSHILRYAQNHFNKNKSESGGESSIFGSQSQTSELEEIDNDNLGAIKQNQSDHVLVQNIVNRFDKNK